MNNKPLILIVDDDPALLKMGASILNDDFAVSCAISGEEAILLLKGDYVPELILLDVNMPKLNGFETHLKIREIHNFKEIPVIYLTGIDEEQSQLKGLNLGAVDYITKPFNKEILIARIRVHLGKGTLISQLKDREKDIGSSAINQVKYEQAAKGLTPTEQKILRLIALGYSNLEIGEELNYSYNYIKKVIGIIYEKKSVNKRSDLIKLFRS